ncbi:hypothetical protein K6T82_13055 [Flavobacterium sp. 17A]|uniref:Lipocalin-like domain-containing protein n=1 Tax=Flavobacterium potami TaxID=2872310 RepID=A0A9X1HBG2_9FLAO|nr:hypothetical protein [Flavobacterium potami]MBZ4035701.1 hypothetical protein [Flavobacterium potami]
MKKLVFFLILFSSILKLAAQSDSKINYDGLWKLEGMEYVGGITFCIEEKNQILIAIQNDTIKWKADVIKTCGKRKDEINSVFIRSGKLKISFGKKSTAYVNVENGEIECLKEEKMKSKDQRKSSIDFTNLNIIKK